MVIDITSGIMTVDFAKHVTTCYLCHGECNLNCGRDYLYSRGRQGQIMIVVTYALYALLAGHWLALAIVILKRDKSPYSVRNLLCTAPTGKARKKRAS